MGFRRITVGTKYNDLRTQDIEFFECQQLESWNPEKVEKRSNHTFHFGCFEYRTFIPNHSLRK